MVVGHEDPDRARSFPFLRRVCKSSVFYEESRASI
jgi:hypothetical protein